MQHGSLLLALILATSNASASDYRLSLEGFGPARLGMDIATLQAALSTPLEVEQHPGNSNCAYATAIEGYTGIAFMLIDGRVVRIDVHAPGAKTLSGAEVGDSEAFVKDLYAGRLITSPHVYGDSYLSLYSADGQYGLRFETYEGKITSFYAGKSSAVELAEGCS